MLRFVLTLSLIGALGACDGPIDPLDAGVADGGSSGDGGAPCVVEEEPGDARAVFALPRGEDGAGFFDLPWPNDVRRTPEGTIDMSRFPNPRSNSFVQRYLDAMTERLGGFATNGAIYFRFSRPVDEGALPAEPEDTLREDATVFLVDVDPLSPDRGSRHAVVVRYQDCPTRYWGAHTLALRPVYGDPLASARTYAAVVTRNLAPRDGGSFARDVDFEALMSGGGDATVDGARGVYDEALSALDEAGVAREDLLAVAVFTTQDAIGETLAIRDWMVSEYPAPVLDEASLRLKSTSPVVTHLTGTYGPVPIFQDGALPYSEAGDGGAIVVDESGVPTVHGEYDARFALTVPGGEMPPGGYPIVLYAHGTGGDYETFVRNDVGELLARQGFAVMGVDQIHHGDRNPTEVSPEVLFFNIPNPQAARDNNRQSALDVVQQARLVPNLSLPIEFGDRGGEAIRFDASRVYFMGHSQGGLNGPIYLAIDDSARGGVLSAASAVITVPLLEKVEPIAIPQVVKALLGLPGGSWQEAFAAEGFTMEHPIATLLQTWLEVSDGSNYAHLVFESPREGFMPKSVLMTEGLLDRYSPPRSIEALAAAMYVPQVEPMHVELEALRIRGTRAIAAPVTANVAGGLATAGLLQFPDDGHFAIFRNETAEAQYVGFFASFLEGGPGTIPAP